MNNAVKNLQLGVSACIIILVGLLYGLNPGKIILLVFDFPVEHLELKNMYRAIMGLYLGFACYWIIGIIKPSHWKSATISNIIFMGGLAFGRILSSILDGFSYQYGIGLLLELTLMFWGIYKLKDQ